MLKPTVSLPIYGFISHCPYGSVLIWTLITFTVFPFNPETDSSISPKLLFHKIKIEKIKNRKKMGITQICEHTHYI